MRSISVKVSNPKERDAVLKAFERCNCHWGGGETPTAWRPMRNYPYYIDRRKDGVLKYGVKNLFNILPVEKFVDDAEMHFREERKMRKIKVKVSNDSERNAVLKAWEQNGCKWYEGEALPDFTPQRDYPYYLFRSDNKKVAHGDVDTGEFSFDFKEVPVDKFRKFMGEQPVITIYSDGKTVRAVGKDGATGIAKCSPEDKFDLKTGAKLAIDRMFEIEVGDKVEVKNSGATFDAYTDFFEQNKLPREMAARYMYRTVPCNGAVGNVVAIHKHESGYCDVAVVEGRNGDIYLLNVRGLKKV